MEKPQKNSCLEPLQSTKMVWVVVLLIGFLMILPIVSAVEVVGTGEAILYIGMIGVFLFFLLICMLCFIHFNNLLVRVGSLGFGYLLLISISFIGWQCADTFLVSPFLIAMLRILFIVLIVGAFPLLIGGFAYYIIMLFKIKEIERLMTKGLSYDEAEHRYNRRSYR